MAFELAAEGDGFVIRLKGHVDFDEIAEANDRLFEDEAWDTHTFQLWSFLDAHALDAEKRDMRLISHVDRATLGKTHDDPLKIAFVCKNFRTKEFLTAYMDAVDEDCVTAALFADESEARAWVGLHPA